MANKKKPFYSKKTTRTDVSVSGGPAERSFETGPEQSLSSPFFYIDSKQDAAEQRQRKLNDYILIILPCVVSTQKQTENDSTQKYPKGNKNTYDDICCLPIHNLIYFFQIDVAC